MSDISGWLGAVRDHAAPLESAQVRLAPIESNEDVSYLYGLYCDPQVGDGWRFDGVLPSYDTFLSELARPVHSRMLILTRHGSHRVGVVVSDWCDLRSGVASASVAVAPPLVGTGLGLLAFGTFANYLFANWPIRKIRVTAPTFVLARYAAAVGPVLQLDGVLREHRFHNGIYWDEHVLSMTPATLKEIESLVPRLVEPNRDAGSDANAVPTSAGFLALMEEELIGDHDSAVTMETSIAEVTDDSLEALSLLFRVEEIVDAEIDPLTFRSWRTIGDVYRFVVETLVDRQLS